MGMRASASCLAVLSVSRALFTRLDLSARQARTYRSTRTSATATFAPPQLVSAITGFVEGPALPPDEESLYYHRENTGTGRFEIYRVTRP